jgi:hypothetical protein
VGCSGEEALNSAELSPEQSASQASPLAATFTGTVVDAKGTRLASAEVTINGTTRLTDTSGRYSIAVEDSRTGYSISVSKFGYESLGTFVAAPPRQEALHTLKGAFVAQIDPTKDSTVVNQTTGLRVNLKANTLVYSDGRRVTSLVRVALAGYAPLAMPGDFTAVNLENRVVALESIGAFSVSAVDDKSVAVNLASGAIADAFVPLPSQAGKMPDCVLNGSCRTAMWRFNSANGRWFEQRSTNVRFSSTGTTFTMMGGPASGGGTPVQTNGGLGTWNADIEKAAPACTIIELNSIAAECFDLTLNVKLLNSSGTLVPSSRTVPAGTSFVALYNIPANVDQEVGITFPATAPAYCAANLRIVSNPSPTDPAYPVYTATGGNTKFNSGAPWGGVGFPTNSGGTPITYADVLAGDYLCRSIVTMSSF